MTLQTSKPSRPQLFAEAKADSERGPIHPANLLVDSTIASAWQAVSLPWVFGGRVTGISPFPELPKPDCTGKVAIVSGSNTGIGYKTALHLAETGAELIMACRSLERGEAAKEMLYGELNKRGVYSPKIKVMQMDLLDPTSIRKFAYDFKAQHVRLDILVNNAGTNIPGVSNKGLDYVFTVSYLGHYMLTNLLYDVIAKTEGARVVNLSSLLHRYGSLEFKDAAEGRRGSDTYFNALFHTYCDSKLAMMLFTQDLRARFAEDKSSAVAFAVSPGNVKSDIWRAVPLWLRIPLDLFMRVAFLSTEQGCFTSVMAALAPLEQLSSNGAPALYLQPYQGPVQQRPFDVIGPFGGALPHKAALPPDLEAQCDRLRAISDKVLSAAEKKAI